MDKKIKSRWNRVNYHFAIAAGVVPAVLGLAFAVGTGRFGAAFGSGAAQNAPEAQLSLALGAAAVMLVVMYALSASGEIAMLREHVEHYLPPLPDMRLPIVGVSLLLPLLIYFSGTLVVFSAIYAGFKLAEIWGGSIATTLIRDGLSRAKADLADDPGKSQTVEALERYYLRRPFTALATTVFGMAMTAIVLSAYGDLAEPAVAEAFRVSAYSVLIVAILGNEVVVFFWRRTRNAALGEYYS